MANKRHLQTSDMSLTYTQERMLDVLYILALEDMHRSGVGEYQADTLFSGKALAMLMGGAWSTWRKRHIDLLIEQGWIVKRSYIRLGWCYRLTSTGFTTLHSRVHRASFHARQEWQTESEGQLPLVWEKK